MSTAGRRSARASARGRTGGLAAAAALIVLLGGCGVPQQDAAQPLPSDAIPSVPAPTQASANTGLTKVYFVSGDRLVAVHEPLSDRSAQGVLAALAAGPPPDDQEELRTLLVDLLNRPMLVVASETPGVEVVLSSTEAYTRMPPSSQTLLIGQVVHSMDQVGLPNVFVTDPAGRPLALPLPDGSLPEGPVGPATAAEYESLLAD